jgi:hypothetical protein
MAYGCLHVVASGHSQFATRNGCPVLESAIVEKVLLATSRPIAHIARRQLVFRLSPPDSGVCFGTSYYVTP